MLLTTTSICMIDFIQTKPCDNQSTYINLNLMAKFVVAMAIIARTESLTH